MFKPISRMLRERDVNRRLADCEGLEGFELVEHLLDTLHATYTVIGRELERIPAEGPVVLVAERPLGLVEAAMLLQLSRQVRGDVRLAANDRLAPIPGLRPLMLPNESIRASLDEGEAVIVGGAVQLAPELKATIVPVSVGMRPARFYGLAAFFRRAVAVPVRIREPIPAQEYAGRGRSPGRLLGFRAPRPMPIARPEDRLSLRRELQGAEVLGATPEGKKILLFDAMPDSSVLRELGRLREVAFREAGEGTGKRRDIDRFDAYYRHVVLWDDTELQIVGAYRLGEAAVVTAARGDAGLYTHGLFTHCETLRSRFGQAFELGRSFVQPRYQGLRALDYLWHGIGAYLRRRPEIRYLFGPVSLSAAYPEAARRMVVHFFRSHFGTQEELARPRFPYTMPPSEEAQLAKLFPGTDYAIELRILKQRLAALNVPVPVLYKQYAELCDEGGTRFLAFNIDPAFSYCVDALVWVDLKRVKAAKRARYIGEGAAALASDAILRKTA